MNIRLVQQGVFYCQERDNSSLDHLIQILCEYCSSNTLQMARVCFHDDHESSLMAMLIVVIGKFAYPPHRHRSKLESYFICRGKCDYVTYNICGSEKERTAMSVGDFIYAHGDDFHSLEPSTHMLAFIEHTHGPFLAGQNEYINSTG